MSKKNSNFSDEEFVIKYLKKNKKFFLQNPELLEIFNFNNITKHSNKIVDLNTYRLEKIKNNYNNLKDQMNAVLKAGSNLISSQNRILKASLKILNTKSLSKLVDLIINDLGTLLVCDIANCFFTSNKIKHKKINLIDNKIASNFFLQKPQTYLNQSPKGIPLFFPNKSKIIKSYMLLKIVFDSDRFIIALGSKNINKFTKDQKVDLIEYLIQVIQIKLVELS